MRAHVLHQGDIFAGRYRVERCIGSGGMGAVYEAEHAETERRVALKVLHPQALHSESARERFKQEARVAGKIRHANVVDVLDAGVDEITDMPYLVMELLHGEDLATRVDRLGPMLPDEAVGFLMQAASALDCLHERQIVHRDLKPENLFLTWGDDGTPILKLLDFGVAKVIDEGRSWALTQDAQGTPVYMAPEQFAEQIRISPATDIYALGMLAFTLLTGQQYWGAEIARGMNVFMLARVAEAGPKESASVRALRAGKSLPPAFDDWFSTITAIVPGERYPTATVAIEALAEVMGVPPSEEIARGSASSSQNIRASASSSQNIRAVRADALSGPASSRGAIPPSPPRVAVVSFSDGAPPPSSTRGTTAVSIPISIRSAGASDPVASGPISGGTVISAPPKSGADPASFEGDRDRLVARGEPILAAPQSEEEGGTPPFRLSRMSTSWRRPSLTTYGLLAAGGILAFVGVMSRSATNPGDPFANAAPPLASSAAKGPPPGGAEAPREAPSTPSIPGPSTASSIVASAPNTSATSSSSAAATSSSAAPAASSATPPRVGPKRADPPPKKPKYTRD